MTVADATRTLGSDFAEFHNAAGLAISAGFRMALSAVQLLALGIATGCEWLKTQSDSPRQRAEAAQ